MRRAYYCYYYYIFVRFSYVVTYVNNTNHRAVSLQQLYFLFTLSELSSYYRPNATKFVHLSLNLGQNPPEG